MQSLDRDLLKQNQDPKSVEEVKTFSQKGTGNARQGSNKPPNFRECRFNGSD